MSNNDKIDAPSFVTVVALSSPNPLTIILSVPRGPNVVAIISANALQAFIAVINYPFPYVVSVPSFNTSMAGYIPN